MTKRVAKKPRQKFVVVVRGGPKSVFPAPELIYVGPYTTFKRAEGDAKAWDKYHGRHTFVEPLMTPSEYATGESTQFGEQDTTQER